MTYYIYKFFNVINGKIYIGKTNDIKIRLSNHKTVMSGGKQKYKKRYQLIHAALRKYGDLIEFRVVQELCSEKEAFAAEKYWIKFYNSNNNKFGYNLTEGGEGTSGHKLSPEHKAALLKASKGRIVSEITKQKNRIATLKQNLSGERNPNSSLSNDNANQIRNLYTSKEYTQNQLGVMFNVDQTTISLIVNNKSYK